jgi:uncharacterized membrane protein
MIRRTATVVFALIACVSPARAATTFEYLFTNAYPTAISNDGNAIAGNTAGAYEPFRWTRSGGTVPLGMGSVPIIGAGGGAPGISADGSRVASTIIGPDSTYYTAGLWTSGPGWQTLVPPLPPGANVVDYGLASVDGISGDGLTVVGLLWGSPRAQAFAWRQATGAVGLGASTGRSSRAMDVNYDGSVIVGWDESSAFGYRGPAVWVNGVRTNLAPHQIGEVHAVTPSGHIVGGMFNDSTAHVRHATLWNRVGNGWSAAQMLPLVPGTENNGGINLIRSLSADGNLAVGYCSFAGDPFYTTGFIWTPTLGTMDVVQFLASQGILPDPSFTIQDLMCVTPDGTKIVGFGRDTAQPYTIRAFMIHVDPSIVGVDDPAPVATVRLLAAPNPVRQATTIAFELAREEAGALTVHDSSGRLVRRLLAGTIPAGPQRVPWDACDGNGRRVPSGIYFTRLVAGSAHESGKLVVID